jgi:dTDP-4-amino-4,6-dideoxygalactose transaminase
MLAIFGGPPAFAEPLHVGRPNLPDKAAILARVSAALERGWLSNGGPLVQEFEQRIAAATHARHCVATSNGTAALELAVRASALAGEVIVPAFTFIATAHALAWHNIQPVFCDVDPTTHTIDPRAVEALITPRTSAILGVHLWGRACDVEGLSAIARRHGLALLFDAAHAFGCTARGRPVGGFGRCEVFSFHATKFVHCGEGGAVTTDDDDLADRLRLLRNFGFAGYDRVTAIGTNAKLSELSAAVGLTSLENRAVIVAANRANHERYRARLGGLRGLSVLAGAAQEQANHQYVVVTVDAETAGLSRDALVAVLFAENVLARRYFSPGCHRMEPYRARFAATGRSLPVTDDLAARVLVLPTGLSVDAAAIDIIASILQRALADPGAVRRRLSRRRAA